MSYPQQLGAFTGLTQVSSDGELAWTCVHCRRQIPDGEGALMAQAGEPWQARCWVHEPPPRQIPVEQIPVEALRTAEAVLIQMAGWVEVSWRTPNWGPLIFALTAERPPQRPGASQRRGGAADQWR